MTRKINTNVHVVSHIKEKIVHLDALMQDEGKKLADIDEDLAKVSTNKAVIDRKLRPRCCHLQVTLKVLPCVR